MRPQRREEEDRRVDRELERGEQGEEQGLAVGAKEEGGMGDCLTSVAPCPNEIEEERFECLRIT